MKGREIILAVLAGLCVAVVLSLGSASWAERPHSPVALAPAPQRAPELADPTRDYLPGELLIKFVHGAPGRVIAAAARSLGAQRLKSFPLIGVERWRLGPGLSVEQALEILSHAPFRADIAYAEPNYIVSAIAFPNDPQRADLWGLHNIGQTGRLKDADIDALEAWDIQQGSATVVVGVIDTGIDYTHPDLKDNIWVNAVEANGAPGVDDDGNGFIDDVRGWDFVNEDNDPFDDHGHGTHVAGTSGAVGNNGIGVAGVNWRVKLMPLKFLSSGGSGSTADAIEAILYAASFRVPITNNSWGGGRRSQALQDAIASSGALFVAAAGNRGSSTKMYPAGYDLENIVSVAATDASDQLARFSNFSSTWVDLGAPGVDILSTLPNNRYGVFSGTSMAAPHVAGVAALVLAQFPGTSTAGLKATILNSVDPNASLQGKTVTGGRLNALKAVGGTETPSSDTVAPASVSNLAVGGVTSSSLTLTWSATGDDGTTGVAYLYDVRYATSPITEESWSSATLAQAEPLPQAPGTLETFTLTGLVASTGYYVALKVADEAGNFSLLSNVAQATTAPGPVWVSETLPDTGGLYRSLAYDSTGNPAIGFSSSNDTVKFARKMGTTWQIQIVDTSASGIDLAYDPADANPSLSYGWGKLKFAHWTGGAWKIQVIEKLNAYNDVTSLVYDPAGNPSISYRLTGAKPAEKFARWNGSSWVLQSVDPGVRARYTSLAYDSAGNPSIAYSVDIDGDGWLDTLKFARWTGSAWQVEIVETGVIGYGVFASLAYDSTGHPTIVHRASGAVRFVRWTGVSWEVELVDSGSYCDLAYDSSGTAWVSYINGTEIKVARRTGPGSWQADVTDRSADPYWQTSLKLDPAGNPSVAYHDWATSTVRYVRRQGP